MKLKELIEKLDDPKIVFINGKQYKDNLEENILEMEVRRINIETEKTSEDNLESLGYSFEVGVWCKCI